MAVAAVTFEALDKRWTFKLGFNALCALEEEFDLPFLQIVQRVFPDLGALDVIDPEKLLGEVVNVRLTELRAIFLAGLDNNGQEVTPEIVGNIIDEVGLDEAGALLRRAITNDNGGGEPSPNPTKARRKR